MTDHIEAPPAAGESAAETKPRSPDRPQIRWLFGLILTAFIGLCIQQALVFPIFEATDEASHFWFADFLARKHTLPNLNLPFLRPGQWDPSTGAMPDLDAVITAHEASQPPLYHIILAALITPFNRDDIYLVTQTNRDWFDKAVNPTEHNVASMYLHERDGVFPFTGAVRAAYAGRLLSIVFGLCTLVCAYIVAGSVFSSWAEPMRGYGPLLVMGILAFNPKIVHMSSTMSNDMAVTAMSAAGCAWMMSRWKRPSGGNAFVFGGLVGLAILTKLSGIALVAGAAVWLWQLKPLRQKALSAAALGAGVLATAGWWFGNNLARYGDPLAMQPVAKFNVFMLRPEPLGLAGVLDAIPLTIISAWGLIGNLAMLPIWFNALCATLVAVAMVGLVWYVAERLRARQPVCGAKWTALFAWVGLGSLLWLAWARKYDATSNARLVMPIIVAILPMLVVGWRKSTLELLSFLRYRRPSLKASLVMGTGSVSIMAAMAVLMPMFAIEPFYSGPREFVPRQALAAPTATVLGSEVEVLRARAQRTGGGAVQVDVTWGALKVMTESYRVKIDLVGAAGQVLTSTLYIPYRGKYSTTQWQPGQYFDDAFVVEPPGQAQAVCSARLELIGPGRAGKKLLTPAGDPGLRVGIENVGSAIDCAPSAQVPGRIPSSALQAQLQRAGP